MKTLTYILFLIAMSIGVSRQSCADILIVSVPEFSEPKCDEKNAFCLRCITHSFINLMH